jgi:hypothetical protein
MISQGDLIAILPNTKPSMSPMPYLRRLGNWINIIYYYFSNYHLTIPKPQLIEVSFVILS